MKYITLYENFITSTQLFEKSRLAINMPGKTFTLPGRTHRNKEYVITKIEDDRFVHASPKAEYERYGDRASSSMFDIKTVIDNNPGINQTERKVRAKSGQRLISKKKYEKILKDAMKDMRGEGHEEFTHDVAQSMIYQEELRARIQKDYPEIRTEEEMIQRLQWDLEMYI